MTIVRDLGPGHVRMYRSATDPEYVREVIRPAVDASGIPVDPEDVARMMDVSGWSAASIIDAIRSMLREDWSV